MWDMHCALFSCHSSCPHPDPPSHPSKTPWRRQMVVHPDPGSSRKSEYLLVPAQNCWASVNTKIESIQSRPALKCIKGL